MGVLPGLGGLLGMSGGGSLSLTYVTYARTDADGSAGSSSCAIPAAAQAGDLCVCLNTVGAFYAAGSGPAYGGSAPSGFTQLGYVAGSIGSTPRGMISAKVLVSDDLGDTLTGLSMSGATSIGWRCMTLQIFRPSSAITSFAAGATFLAVSSGSNPAAQTISWSANTARPLLGVYMTRTFYSGTISHTGMTSVYETTSEGYGYEIVNGSSAPTNRTVDTDFPQRQLLMSGYIVVT